MTTNPPTAAKFLQILRDEGLNVIEVGDWRIHNRASKGPWGPVYGVLIHHTVTSGSARTVALCRDGYPGLTGPLCHGVITKDGTVHLVGYGRANHAGGGDPAVLMAVQREDYGVAPPKPTRGNEDGVDGNRSFYGFECENLGNGKDPWPAAQLAAIDKVAAAICRYHGWTEKSVIGHMEWSDDKIDPRGFTMASMRARVKKLMEAKVFKPKYHTVIPGDTLYSIARERSTAKNQITVGTLRLLNPMVRNDVIVPGDSVTGKIRYA